jgi:hypothetical protein
MLLENAMAGEMPPTTPPEGYSIPEDYEFEPDDDLGAGNELLDEVLTRAGEFALDTIEFIQEHPVLAASMAAVGFGAVVGLVASALVPRRRPSAQESAASAAAEAAAQAATVAAGLRLGERLGEAQGLFGKRLSATQEALGARLAGTPERLGEAAETARGGVREAGALGGEAVGRLSFFGRRAGSRAREAAEELADKARHDGSADVGSAVAGKARQAGYMVQLLPLALALLRNPIVRDMLAGIIASRLRKTARL